MISLEQFETIADRFNAPPQSRFFLGTADNGIKVYAELERVNFATQLLKIRLLDPNKLLEEPGALKEVDLMNPILAEPAAGEIVITDVKEDSFRITPDRAASIDFAKDKVLIPA